MLTAEQELALKKLNNIPFKKGTIIAKHRNGPGGFSVYILSENCELPKYSEELFRHLYRSNTETINCLYAKTGEESSVRFGNLDFPFILDELELHTYSQMNSNDGDSYLYQLLESKHEFSKKATF